jgi:hypothetical protein
MKWRYCVNDLRMMRTAQANAWCFSGHLMIMSASFLRAFGSRTKAYSGLARHPSPSKVR